MVGLMICYVVNSQQHVSKTMIHGGLNRQYLEYVPTIYDGSSAVPLLICLHGLGDNMTNFSNIGMYAIADTANFIVVTPQAQSSVIGAAWNSGASMSGMQLNQTIDDIGFIGKLIDSVASFYNVDLRRVYVTGFSMGGFMCNRLACEYGHRITAIASVAGTIGSALQCNPSRLVPVAHFHGSADGTIGYTGNQYGIDVDSLLAFWSGKHGCNSMPTITMMPDVVSDGFTVEHHVYNNQTAVAPLEHYKVIGADHQWIYTPENDIDYALLIWKFLSKFSNESLNVEPRTTPSAQIYPNPVKNSCNLVLNFEATSLSVYSMTGELVQTSAVHGRDLQLDLSHLANGVYLFRVLDQDMRQQYSTLVQVQK